MNCKKINKTILLLVNFALLLLLTSCVQETTAHISEEPSNSSEINISLHVESDNDLDKQLKQAQEDDKLELEKVNEELEVIAPQKDIQKIKELILSDEFPELLLVSKSHPLVYNQYPNYIVPNTVPATRDLMVNDKVLVELETIFSDIVQEQINDLLVVSGYRDVEYQEMLFKREMNKYISNYSEEEAFNLASQAVAIPGTSEHHTGLAVDFISSTQYSLTASFETTPSGSWLFDNAYKYGFILRYPKDKTDITGIMFEPWHYRYVGKPHAEYIKKENICFEEYIDLLQSNKEITFTSEDSNTYTISFIDDIETYDFNNSIIDVDNIFEITDMGQNSYIVTTIE